MSGERIDREEFDLEVALDRAMNAPIEEIVEELRQSYRDEGKDPEEELRKLDAGTESLLFDLNHGTPKKT